MRWLSAILCPAVLVAAAAAQAPEMTKVDPPNWWVNMPKPMLLIQGDHLAGATFRVSGEKHGQPFKLERTSISANGHYAELWLSASPTQPEDITITASTGSGKATLPFHFGRRRSAADGFSGFSSKDVMYLIMTDRFADGDPSNDGPSADRTRARAWHGGDLRGVMDHLDYLQDLGITTVWITPVYQNHGPQSYHGYGATDMYAVDEHFGSLQQLQALSAALHQRHMKLVMDMVPNHIGPAHPWVEDEPEPTWFHGTKAEHHKAQTEFRPLTNPHAPWRDQRDVTEGWFADALPDMNQENPDAAQYLMQNVLWWTEQTGLDGIRFDTFPYVQRPFWADLHKQLFSLWPNLTDVGEVYNGDPVTTSSFAGGVTRDGADTGLYTPFDFPSYFALRDVFLKGESFSRLDNMLREDSLFPHPERLVPFLGNHDTARFLSEKGATPRQLQLAFAVLLTMRGMPEIYSGDEIAMLGGDDPDNRRDFPGGFPGDAQSAFAPAQQTAEQKEMHTWVRSLLHLRAAHPALQSGKEQVLATSVAQFAYVRNSGSEHVLVAVNNSDAPSTLHIVTTETSVEGVTGSQSLLGEGTVTVHPGSMDLQLPARGLVIASLR